MLIKSSNRRVVPNNDNVSIDFEWEFSQIRGFEQRTNPDGIKYNVPLVAVDNVDGTVVVPNGKTLLIGGKESCRYAEKSRKVPVLGDMPLIGGLFRHMMNVADTENILILIKPIINPKTEPLPTPSVFDPDGPLIKDFLNSLKIQLLLNSRREGTNHTLNNANPPMANSFYPPTFHVQLDRDILSRTVTFSNRNWNSQSGDYKQRPAVRDKLYLSVGFCCRCS